VLSNGKYPTKVAVYLKAFFYGLADLEFTPYEDKTKIVN